MDQLNFMIESSEAVSMSKTHGFKSVLELLPFIVRSAQKLARPPISGFAVAAAGLASDGRVFIGVNVEFPKLPLHHSIHAEQFLIVNLSRYPETTLTNLVVSAYPCGHCRQFLQEIRGAHNIQISVLDHCLVFRALSCFLPHRFGPDDLLEKDVPLILENHENGLSLLNQSPQGQNGHLLTGFSTSLFDLKTLVLCALEAANMSHAPYSGCPSGMALINEEGRIFKGSYLECAAYNPSLGPAQAAMIDYIADSKEGSDTGYGKIAGAVLVEKEGAVVRQEETVKLFLMAVSPQCQFHVYHCKNSTSIV